MYVFMFVCPYLQNVINHLLFLYFWHASKYITLIMQYLTINHVYYLFCRRGCRRCNLHLPPVVQMRNARVRV